MKKALYFKKEHVVKDLCTLKFYHDSYNSKNLSIP